MTAADLYRPEREAQEPGARAEEQLERLRTLVDRLRTSRSGFWRRRLDDVHGDDLASLRDLAALPFTRKDDLRDTYPLGMLAVPVEEVVRFHASSGTSGLPTLVAYTAGDLAVFGDVVARSIVAGGGSSRDVLHIAYGYGLFTGGLGLHIGAERLGAAAVPASGGNTALQLQLLADLGAAGLACTPSFAMLLAERAAAEGVTGLRVRYGILGAEPWSDGYRQRLAEAWQGVTGHPFVARDIYGLSEVIGPGVAMECVEAPGALHLFDDHFLPEIVDPGTGAPLPDGERGELVITTLTKEALPVVRYRTGDVTSLTRGRCPCGRTHPRIGRIQGRTDDMLIVRGVNVFPREIEAALLGEPALAGAYLIVLDRTATLARLEVHAEASDAGADLERLARQVAARLGDRLRLQPEVRIHPPGTLPRTEAGKAKRVFERGVDRLPEAVATTFLA